MTAAPVVYAPDGQHDMAWLQANWGTAIAWHAASGHHFALTRINIMTTGDTLIRIWVQDAAGQVPLEQPVTYSYPTLANPDTGLPLIPMSCVSRWAARGVQNKNLVPGDGYVDFQIGTQSWIGPSGRGPYAAWVLSPSIPSDCLDGIGWKGGTDHYGPCELFFEEVTDTVTPPPTPPNVATILQELATVSMEIAAITQQVAALE